MFEYVSMASSATVHSLQQRIAEMQPLRLGDTALPTAAELSALLPGGALRKGGSYAVHGSTTLGIALLAEASRSGAWCGIIGVPELGIESAVTLGLALDRCILIPAPGEHALGIAHTLSEVLTVVLLKPTQRPRHGETERLAARLRDHGAALVVLGDWPRADSTLRVTHSEWSGIDAGHGMLNGRDLSVQSEDRRGIRQHLVHFTRGHLAPRSTVTTNMLRAVPS